MRRFGAITAFWVLYISFCIADKKCDADGGKCLSLEAKKLRVKAAMQRAWNGYRTHAFGSDELRPLKREGWNRWGGYGITIIDSLDTLWMMGMKKEFAEAREWVASSLDYSRVDESTNGGWVSVFETTIRGLGGLLGAFALSQDKVFLDKARELGTRLLPAFKTPSGMPLSTIKLSTGEAHVVKYRLNGQVEYGVALSEVGTLQLEMKYLSEITGDPKFQSAADKAFNVVLERGDVYDGLYPIHLDASLSSAPVTNMTGVAAFADSFYEYLLKLWLQSGKRDEKYRVAYDKAVDGIHKRLLHESPKQGLSYLADYNGTHPHTSMHHLACFIPGMLALGAATATKGTPGRARAPRDLSTAQALMKTCFETLRVQPTKLAPDCVDFEDGEGDNDFKVCLGYGNQFYFLRPEISESLYVMHQLSGNETYREMAWELFQGIERNCKAGVAFGVYPDVREAGLEPEDCMESFFLAETLKYLYLIFSDQQEVTLESHVYNTEAHPIPQQSAAGAMKGRLEL